MERHFGRLLSRSQADQKYLCVGLDPDFEKIPAHLRSLGVREGLMEFNRAIIDATRDVAGSYKPNTAFYEAHGADGWDVLRDTVAYINATAPDAAVIADAKRADIGNTNNGYAEAIFGMVGADAITVHPYLGSEALQPFLARKDKGVFILCRTSNPGSGEIQDLNVEGMPLYQRVARSVHKSWNVNGNCGLVVGATYPSELTAVREITDMPILIPGIGAQGGDVEETVRAAKRSMLVAVSRSIMYASAGPDFAAAAARSAQEIHSSLIKAAVL